ncbi:hypothetical protein LOZ80_12155 [Paenibacillus sp. HWE-109]|uniref:DUF6557 family protein n=1 Tax=Paenibacillus sp. HWE-109 TaxID=1306526 RepID=UPI001EDE0202|nr:DUF6557 family protein [Paenibacillus sp. HWE-109]UKS29637.1 hypothetical protein LOZ80_12155 [Paenibacillus sp. HWE-109]
MKALIEFLNMVKWESVEGRLPELYPDMKEATVLSKYNYVFNQLLTISSEENTEELVIQIYEVTDVSEDNYWAVSGRKRNDSIKYNISFDSWEKWLGYWVDDGGLDQVDIIAHCLYEMTWGGFSQEEIRNKYNQL